MAVGEFVGEITIGSSCLGLDIETVSAGALVQPIRKDAIRLNATMCRYAILNFINILHCLLTHALISKNLYEYSQY